MLRLGCSLAVLLLSGCGPSTREIQLLPLPGICVGVVRLSIQFVGAANDGDLLHEVPVDPGQPSCRFASLSVEHVPPGEGRRVVVEGYDSAGQLLISGSSGAFSDPADGAVTAVALSRTQVGTGTVLFTIPTVWDGQYDFLNVGALEAYPNPRVLAGTRDSMAWDGSRPPHKFAVSGLPAGKVLYVWPYTKSGQILNSYCTLGVIADLQTRPYAAKTVDPKACTVITP